LAQRPLATASIAALVGYATSTADKTDESSPAGDGSGFFLLTIGIDGTYGPLAHSLCSWIVTPLYPAQNLPSKLIAPSGAICFQSQSFVTVTVRNGISSKTFNHQPERPRRLRL